MAAPVSNNEEEGKEILLRKKNRWAYKEQSKKGGVTEWFKVLLPLEHIEGNSRLLEQDGQGEATETGTGDQHSWFALVCGVVVNQLAHKVGRVVDAMEVLVLLVFGDGHVFVLCSLNKKGREKR